MWLKQILLVRLVQVLRHDTNKEVSLLRFKLVVLESFFLAWVQKRKEIHMKQHNQQKDLYGKAFKNATMAGEEMSKYAIVHYSKTLFV